MLGIREINNHYREVNTTINQNNLGSGIYAPNIDTVDLNNQLNNIVVFDLECYRDKDWVFHPYACGFFFLSIIRQCYSKPNFSEEEISKFKDKVKITTGNNCIESM